MCCYNLLKLGDIRVMWLGYSSKLHCICMYDLEKVSSMYLLVVADGINVIFILKKIRKKLRF